MRSLHVSESRIADDIVVGEKVIIKKPVNLYGCELRNGSFVGPFVEIQRGVVVGENTRISSHTFICDGVRIGDNCFIGHGVMFINDKFDQPISDWIKRDTVIGNNVRIGSNATIMPVKIGNNAIIGAGSVVTKDVLEDDVVAGNPAKSLKKLSSIS